MPLLEAPPPSDTPLSQGDVVEVLIHGTDVDGAPCSFDAQLGLVISRDCVGAHKRGVLVAPIVQVRDRHVSESELRRARESSEPHEEYVRIFRGLIKALEATRDGGLSPDRVYLGPVPDDDKRLVAKLDEVGTVLLPEDLDERARWVAERRKATLSLDARRALPTRLFWSFTRVGFDDHEWLPSPDLQAVCAAGDAAVAALKNRVSVRELEVNQSEAAGASGKKHDKAKKDGERMVTALEQLSGELEPFKAELRRRQGTAG